MKKQLLLMLLALPLIGYFACRKSDHQIPVEQIKDPFAREAAQFLEKQLSANDYASLDFTDYSLMKKSETEAIGVRFNVKGTEGKKFAVVGKTDKGLIGNWVDVSDMSSGTLAEGVLKTRNFSNDIRNEVSFVKNRVVKISTVANSKTTIRSIRYNAKGEQLVSAQMSAVSKPDSEEDWQWLPPVTVVGYKNNYSSPTFFSLFYYYNQSLSYLYTYSTVNPYTGGGGYTVEVPPVVIAGGQNINVNKAMNCFNQVSDNGASYSITLYADLPDNSNSNTLFVGGTPGHAFVKLTKSNGPTTVSQTFGFYPTVGQLSVFNSAVSSSVKNDGGHEYNASYSIPLDNVNFNAAKNIAVSLAGMQYDLNDYNCTDYALQIFNSTRLSNEKLFVEETIFDGPFWDMNYGRTPNGLYNLLYNMKNFDQNSNVTIYTDTAPQSTGECN